MRILNLGSLNFDKVYDVAHFVTRGETILSGGYGEFLGGKGLNQSLALARAGAEVYHAGAVGPDGALLRQCLTESGVDVGYLQKVEAVSGHAVIQNAGGQNCIIVWGGANQCVSCEYIREVLENFGEGDVLLLQNEVSNVPFAMEEAKRRGLKIAFNASPITAGLMAYPLELVDWFLINEVEGKALSSVSSDDPEEILTGLVSRFPGAAIVLTIGEQGVLYRHGETRASHGIYRVEVADTTAAGDTFCGYFLTGLAKGLSIEDTLNYASVASAIAVSRNGASTSIPTWDEVMKFCKEANQ